MKQIKQMKQPKKRQKMKEAKRQLFHAVFGLSLVFIFYFDLLPLWIFGALIFTGCMIYWCWKPGANILFEWFFQHFERDGDREGKGALWYCIGCFLALLLFPKNSALAAIIILALGDSTSHFAGRFYGRISNPLDKKKKIEGTIAGILAGFVGAVVFVPPVPAFIAAGVAMTVEAMEWKIGDWRINDNFLIPIVAGGILLLFHFV